MLMYLPEKHLMEFAKPDGAFLGRRFISPLTSGLSSFLASWYSLSRYWSISGSGNTLLLQVIMERDAHSTNSVGQRMAGVLAAKLIELAWLAVKNIGYWYLNRLFRFLWLKQSQPILFIMEFCSTFSVISRALPVSSWARGKY